MSTLVHRIVNGDFVCTAASDADCRNYPECDCEAWDVDTHGKKPRTGHEPVPQPTCWIWEWLTATDLHDSYMDEDWNEAPLAASFPDGPVEWTWEHDYVTWHYSDGTEPVAHQEDES